MGGGEVWYEYQPNLLLKVTGCVGWCECELTSVL